jgi:hypothetical protein
MLPPQAAAVEHPTSNPYEVRPTPDGTLGFQIVPLPQGLVAESDVMIPMPDGVKLAANIHRPAKDGKFPVIVVLTPYGKDQAPPVYKPDGSFPPNTYFPFVFRTYAHGADLGHMKVSMLTGWEGPDPAFWVKNDYVVVVVDQRGGFKSGGKFAPLGLPGYEQTGDDAYQIIEWAAAQEWSNGNVGMTGVSALCINQYYAAGHDPAPPHLKAIIPWEGFTDVYRDALFWGGIPETNFNRSLGPWKAGVGKMPAEQAARVWVEAMDPVASQKIRSGSPHLERINIPTLLCASWSDKGLHTLGSFEAFNVIPAKDKWLYVHGGKKWERYYGEDALAYQKKFFDHYLKGIENGWTSTPRVRLEVRETRDEYTVRNENEFPLARTQYKKLFLDARDGSLKDQPAPVAKVSYNSTQGGNAVFGITFNQDTELTGYMKLKLWVAAESANDMDLFVVARKFAGPCDVDTPTCQALEAVTGKDQIAKGNEIHFRGQNGEHNDAMARGQMRVSQRELDSKTSTAYKPMQKFVGEKKLKPGEIVPVEILLLPSSTFFRKGESLSVVIQGYAPVDQALLYYDWLVNQGRHIIYTGGKYDSYLQVPVIPR